jgi:23S rRNA (cytosine1962-C5)-methyltransferase
MIKKGRAGPSFGRHPWLFSNAIEKVGGVVEAGSEVEVLGDRGDFLGYGILNPKSDIRVRIYSWDKAKPLTKDFWFDRIKSAVELRTQVLKVQDSASVARLIFSEGDGLSGLVVDRFADYLVLQITSLAMFQRKNVVVEALQEFCRPKGIFFRAEKNILKAEGVEAEDEILFGDIPSSPIEVLENGIRFAVDLRMGQKTGFYADQRENRLLARSFAKNRRALDLFCYTGGFGLNLSVAGAKEVVCVDSSETAISTAKANADLNSAKNIHFECADALEFLSQQKQNFDLIVLDPPRFAPSRGSREKALRTYFKTNLEALRILSRGGIFVSFSCSHQIGRQDFNSMLSSVFRKAGRSARILYQGSQGPDHPISASCPETEYLKAVFCWVE